MTTKQKITFAVLYIVAIAAGIVAGTRIFDAIAF